MNQSPEQQSNDAMTQGCGAGCITGGIVGVVMFTIFSAIPPTQPIAPLLALGAAGLSGFKIFSGFLGRAADRMEDDRRRGR